MSEVQSVPQVDSRHEMLSCSEMANQKALHVVLPEEAIVHLKVLAAKARLPVKVFLATLLLSQGPEAIVAMPDIRKPSSPLV